MRNQHVVLVEAVNLNKTAFSTEQLSVSRSGSRILNEWPSLFCERESSNSSDIFGGNVRSFDWPEEFKFDAISTGGARLCGVLEVGSGSNKTVHADWNPTTQQQSIYDYLESIAVLNFANFVCSVEPIQSDFYEAYQRAQANNRVIQYEQLDVSLPPWNTVPDIGPCSIDDKAPADATIITPENKPLAVSAHIKKRIEIGRQLRAPPPLDRHKTTQSLEHLALSDDKLQPWESKLAGKVAYLYLDGNQFGRHEKEAARIGYQQLSRWDRELSKNYSKLLTALNHSFSDSESWFLHPPDTENKPEEKSLRFELLQGGGDDLLFVVPAWTAIDAILTTFRSTRRWQFSGRNLTFSIGMVICHSNAPVRNAIALAKQLSEEAKASRRSLLAKQYAETHASNAIAYQILESFDHMGGDYQRARDAQRPAFMSWTESTLSPEFIEELQLVKRNTRLSNSTRHSLLQRIHNNNIAGFNVQLQRHIQLSAQNASSRPGASHTGDQRDSSDQDSPLPVWFENSMTRGEDGVESALTMRADTSDCIAWHHLLSLWDLLGKTHD